MKLQTYFLITLLLGTVGSKITASFVVSQIEFSSHPNGWSFHHEELKAPDGNHSSFPEFPQTTSAEENTENETKEFKDNHKEFFEADFLILQNGESETFLFFEETFQKYYTKPPLYILFHSWKNYLIS